MNCAKGPKRRLAASWPSRPKPVRPPPTCPTTIVRPWRKHIEAVKRRATAQELDKSFPAPGDPRLQIAKPVPVKLAQAPYRLPQPKAPNVPPLPQDKNPNVPPQPQDKAQDAPKGTPDQPQQQAQAAPPTTPPPSQAAQTGGKAMDQVWKSTKPQAQKIDGKLEITLKGAPAGTKAEIVDAAGPVKATLKIESSMPDYNL
jgi:hypothetical protein